MKSRGVKRANADFAKCGFAGFHRAKKASRTRSKNDHIKTPTHSLRHRFCESALLQVWVLDITENKEVAENTELKKQQEIGTIVAILWLGTRYYAARRKRKEKL